MPTFGSLMTAMARALPGYIQGERLAVEDNWRDLNQYNQAQAGQLNNAFTEATFPYAITNARNNAAANEMALARSARNLTLDMATFPGMMDTASVFNANALGAAQRLYQQGMGLLPGENGTFNPWGAPLPWGYSYPQGQTQPNQRPNPQPPVGSSNDANATPPLRS